MTREVAARIPAVVDAARQRLDEAGAGSIDGGLILGSGLSYLADALDEAVTVSYGSIDGFPRSTVAGHAGNFVVGTLEGGRVAVAQGRFHLYEGYPPPMVSLIVRVFHALTADWMLVTNAAGSLDRRMAPGSLMAIRDHINLQFANPLIGRAADDMDNPWPDMAAVYDDRLRARLHDVAVENGIRLYEGVYTGVLGPSYETAAEIEFLRRIGGSAVGMSTVPEVVTAAELMLPVAGVSLITNYGTGMTADRLQHAAVTEAGRAARGPLEKLVRGFVRSAAV